MEKQLLINTIYMATEGEGVRVGTPQIFVRTQGCAIGCVNCDSKETWDFTAVTAMNLSAIVERVYELAGSYPKMIKNVSITGGDPLHPKHTDSVIALAQILKKEGFWVNIEASGSRVVDQLFDIVDFISFDVKTPSTGVKTNTKLLEKLITQYAGKFQLKSVISHKHDFEYVYDLQNKLPQTDYPWFLTPSYEPHESFPKERFELVIGLNQEFGGSFRVVGQQHKWVFGPNRKEV